MNLRHIRRLRRALVGVAVIAALWAGAIALTGGIAVHAFGVPITSRNPRNPLWLLLISTLLAWALPIPDRRGAVERAWRRNADVARSIHQGSAWLRWLDAARFVGVAAVMAELFFWAGARPLWLDEQMIALNLRDRSTVQLAGPLWLAQAAPFGWLALQRAALVSFGTSEIVLRLVPMLFGCGLTAVTVWMSRRSMSSLAAALFVLLCALGQWLSHYPFELKHYSADAFWGLLVPALAVWTMEAAVADLRTRRYAAWWATALVGLWFSYGALLVTPPCALLLLVDAWRRGGWRTAARFVLMGTAWLVSFGVHYVISLEHTATDDLLREYWSRGFPPSPAVAGDILHWLVSRLETLAANPGGTTWWMTFWVVAFWGFALAEPRTGVLLAAVPLWAIVLGLFRVVPLHDRLALWIVPVLYFGIALFVDGWFRRVWYSARPWGPRLILTVLIAAAGLPVCADIIARGWREYRLARWPDSNHGVDDRAAVRWLMEQRRSGDAIMTTHLGLPAFWWYGGVPLSGASAGSTTSDGGPIFEVGLQAGPDCGPERLRELLADRRRVLVYTGFPDQPAGFDAALLTRLTELGVLIAERSWATSSHAAVIELGAGRSISGPSPDPARTLCIGGTAARRW